MKIIFDMDGVITNFVESAVDFLNEKTGKNLYPENIRSWGFYQDYGIPQSTMKNYMNEMMEKPDFWQNMAPMNGMRNVLRELNNNFLVRIVTTPIYNQVAIQEKYEWIKVHLSFINDNQIIFCRDRSSLLADYLIDDCPKNLEDFKLDGILFQWPYNRNAEIPYRVENWQEIEEFFNDKRGI